VSGKNFVMLPEREEPIAAGVAAISREMQHALQPGEPARNVLAGDTLQVEIATLRTMNVKVIRNGHYPGEEPGFAGPTTPGPKT